eukprot:305608-Chlamydomonas_euryale.AAC.4
MPALLQATGVWADATRDAGYISIGQRLDYLLPDHLPMGPHMTFGAALLQGAAAGAAGAAAAAPPAAVGFVPTALGGTPLSAWMPPDGPQWRAMTDGVAHALAAAGPGARVRGLLWVQGESDALSESDAKTYRTRLVAFLASLRARLAAYHSALPVVMAVMSTARRADQFPYIQQVGACQRQAWDLRGRGRGVRDAQLSVANSTENVLTVDMADFEFYAQDMGYGKQWTHLTKRGECDMGTAMASAWLASGLA